MTEIRVALPATYRDSPDNRSRLAWEVSRTHPGLDLQVVDVQSGPAATVVIMDDTGSGPRTTPVPVTETAWCARDGAARVEALLRQRGLTLATWDPARRAATAMRAGTYDDDLRGVAAAHYGVSREPWRLTVRSGFVPGRLDTVSIARDTGLAAHQGAYSLLAALPEYQGLWQLAEDTYAREVVMTWQRRPELPATVPLADLLPATIDSTAWATIPLGLGTDGRPVGVNLLAGPHGITQGATGSGKTVALVGWAAQALLRGHDVIVVDPVKDGADFEPLRPYLAGFATTFEAAASIMELAYAEGARRRALFRPHGAVKWSDLPADVRLRERVRPLTIFLDEYESLTEPPAMIKGLRPGDPLAVEAEELADQKARIAAYTQKIARELRSAGVHLALATQTASAEALKNGGGTGLRRNLTSAVMLVAPGKTPEDSNVKFLFSGQQTDQALEVADMLDDGAHLGLGLVAAEGGAVAGMRVGYAAANEVAGILAARGVPLAVPLAAASPVATVELATIEMTMEDLLALDDDGQTLDAGAELDWSGSFGG